MTYSLRCHLCQAIFPPTALWVCDKCLGPLEVTSDYPAIAGASVYRPRIIAVRGNYDDVNRLCTQVADKYGWGFANINLRAYYAEGAKTYGFEIAEQLGWRMPRHVVCPVAGGTLLPRILKG